MADIFDGVDKLGKGEFVSIRNYANSKGEVADYIINGNITYQNIKNNDNKKLHECTEEILQQVANDKNIDIAIVRNALAELIDSSDRNLNSDSDNRTAQSLAQSDAYINLGKGLKMNKETKNFHLDGLIVTKKVIVEGTYPQVASRSKTIAKRTIEKTLELQAPKYRSFIIEEGHCEYVNLSGMTANP